MVIALIGPMPGMRACGSTATAHRLAPFSGSSKAAAAAFAAGDAAALRALGAELLDLALELGAHEARFIPLRQIGAGCGSAAPNQLTTFRALLALLEGADVMVHNFKLGAEGNWFFLNDTYITE